MPKIVEINRIDQLAPLRQDWATLLGQTPGASFFQSLEWLDAYWRSFGEGQTLRVMVVSEDGRTLGIVPLVVRRERSKVGWFRMLTFPLHNWGSFYGPIGPDPGLALTAALEHVRKTPRDWDVLELRWQGAPGTEPQNTQQAMRTAGFQGYGTVWNRTAVVDIDGPWESYWAARKGAWLRRFHRAERKLAERGEISYVRHRPAGEAQGDGSPRWDLYDACEEIAQRSWQSEATNGTTLSDESVRGFLRETHQTAAAAGMADLNLLLVGDKPVAFIYGYHGHGSVYGLRRGYDADCAREGAGNVLLAYTLRDSFARGDQLYDMGIGSLAGKRHFQTRLVPILRYSHFAPWPLRAQLLRLKRWWQQM